MFHNIRSWFRREVVADYHQDTDGDCQSDCLGNLVGELQPFDFDAAFDAIADRAAAKVNAEIVKLRKEIAKSNRSKPSKPAAKRRASK